MEDILTEIGVDHYSGYIYEYNPVKINWWNEKLETSIEIEIYKDEENLVDLSIIFCPFIEEIVERTIVFTSTFKEDSLVGNTIIAKSVAENLLPAINLEYSEKHNGYLIDSYLQSYDIFKKLTSLIVDKIPIVKLDLNSDEDLEEETATELGDTLEHFIAMMQMNSATFTKDGIVEHLEMATNLEGKDYIEELKNDANSDAIFDFQTENNISEESMKEIKKIIKTFTIK